MAFDRRVRRSFHESPQLQRFIIENVRPTGRQLGVGSYGSVEELEVDGLRCAGKKLHDTLVEVGNEGVQEITQKFVEECELMSGLQHPHIVQFLGICFLWDTNLPVLIMECLLTSLNELLESRPDIPLYLKRSILRDVACGLVYLHNHSPPIIHRDLTSRNILLNSAMVAKIVDLGVARILDLRPGQLEATMTQTPGTLAYTPPEALEENPKYNAAVDVFAFGVLSLFTVIQEFPLPTAPTCMDPDNPGSILGRSEVQRRARFIDQLMERLGGGHLLVYMITQCLQNDPRKRPSAREALQQLDVVKSQIEDPYEHVNKLEMIQTLENTTARIHQLEEEELPDVRSQLDTKDSQLCSMQQELDALRDELETLKGEHQHGPQAEELQSLAKGGTLSRWWKKRKVSKQVEKEAARRSKEIDKEQRPLVKEDLGLKILLLGQGESGKTTFIEQLCFIHEPGWYSDENRLSEYQIRIHRNTITAMKALIRALEIPLSNPKNKEYKEMIMAMNEWEDFKFFPLTAQALKSLWEDKSIRAALQHTIKSSGGYDDEPLLYFLNHLNRIGAKDYTLSVEDIFHSRLQSTGIIESTVHIKHSAFRFVDVGGVRSERSKWIRTFDGVSELFFLVPSNGFDQMLLEDGRTNRLVEGARLFESIVNNKWFGATSIVVLFTKTDLLLEKIRHVNIRDHFPDFPGDPHNLDDVKQFLRTMFESQCRGNNSSRVLGYYFIVTTNTEDVKAVFDKHLDSIIGQRTTDVAAKN